ncbi:MAG: PIG-L family deacetylase [Xanthobacteraceae bacterium]|nr:PIG-L family deacetylase [Xanthobacteraceae bacterium]
MSFSSSERLLVIAAHPDDETLGCGGTIARFRQAGAAVRVVCLAEGTSVRFPRAEIEGAKARAALAEREGNAKKAVALLGVVDGELFLDWRVCCELDTMPQVELVRAIERHVREFRPTRLYTHAASDTNVDHRAVHWAALTAARPLWPGLKQIAAFEVPSSTDWNPSAPFAPTLFVDISETIKTKLAAAAAYGSEMPAPPHSRSIESLEALARMRGSQAGVMYAEGFQLLRGLEG